MNFFSIFCTAEIPALFRNKSPPPPTPLLLDIRQLKENEIKRKKLYKFCHYIKLQIQRIF